MSGDSGSEGRFGRDQINRERYENALTDLRTVLASADVAGSPGREAELIELERLVGEYPDEAAALVAKLPDRRDPS